MSDLLIAVNNTFASNVEELISYVPYTKVVKEDGSVFFEFSYDNWGDHEDGFPPNLMTFLFSVVGITNFAFIRKGEDVDDLEVLGDLDQFDICISVKVTY